MPTITPLVLDLFAEEPTIFASRKRKRTRDDDLETVLLRTQSAEHQQIEVAKHASILDKEMRRTSQLRWH